jgi:hypothetical protein
MKALLKNWLLPNNCNSFLYRKKKALLCFLFFSFIISKGQIANYVNNGGFEICGYCASTPSVANAKYWNPIDTNKYMGIFLSKIYNPYLIPASSFTYQWPKSGNNILLSTLFFKPNTNQTGRGYPRNTLKQILQSGHTYCVKVYYSITNQSSYGVDGLGAYFGNNTLDTITKCDKPIIYLTPQIQNPTNNLLIDTLSWSLLTGTFVANGSEKYMMLGNFKSDVTTNTVMINPTNLPGVFCEILYDDVSVIDIDLPAYAGPDIWGVPTNTVYLGRPQDVGIDEACMWYKLPNTTTAIDTAAGITVTVGLTTNTYVVRQEICGNVKWDTVIVYPSATGLSELEYFKNNISVFPNPANDILNISFNLKENELFSKISIFNNLGQLIREEELKNNSINIKDLLNGVYILNFYGDKVGSVNKRFVVAR